MTAVVVLAGCTWLPLSREVGPSASVSLRLVSVADGDTFTAEDRDGQRVKVRLLGIDAPERARDGAPAECGSEQATQALGDLLEGRALVLESDPRADPTDRFGRRLAYVRVDGEDVALALIGQGMAEAWYPASEPRPERFGDYDAAERSSRNSGVGLWGVCERVGR